MSIKVPVTLSTNMATAGLGVIDTLLNHSKRMKEIENSYILEKKKMDYAYKLELQKIDNEMEKFKEMVKAYSKNSKYQHLQQMELLHKAQELSMKIIEIDDIEKCKILTSQVERYLAIYEKNSSKGQKTLGYHKPLTISK